MSAGKILKIPVKYSKNLTISQVSSASFFRSGTKDPPALGVGKIVFFYVAMKVADVAVSVSEPCPTFYLDSDFTALKGNIELISATFEEWLFVAKTAVRVSFVEDGSKFGIFIFGGHFVYLKG